MNFLLHFSSAVFRIHAIEPRGIDQCEKQVAELLFLINLVAALHSCLHFGDLLLHLAPDILFGLPVETCRSRLSG